MTLCPVRGPLRPALAPRHASPERGSERSTRPLDVHPRAPSPSPRPAHTRAHSIRPPRLSRGPQEPRSRVSGGPEPGVDLFVRSVAAGLSTHCLVGLSPGGLPGCCPLVLSRGGFQGAVQGGFPRRLPVLQSPTGAKDTPTYCAFKPTRPRMLGFLLRHRNAGACNSLATSMPPSRKDDMLWTTCPALSTTSTSCGGGSNRIPHTREPSFRTLGRPPDPRLRDRSGGGSGAKGAPPVHPLPSGRYPFDRVTRSRRQQGIPRARRCGKQLLPGWPVSHRARSIATPNPSPSPILAKKG